MSVVVLDTESSGHLGEARASVIEIGAVALSSTRKELGVFSSLIRPLAPLGDWSYHAMNVNRIDPVLLRQAPTREEVWSALISWMSLYKPIEAVLAYNVSFDQKIAIKTWPLAEHLPWGPCVMRAASEILEGHRKGVKLHAAAEALGSLRPAASPHQALYDARVAAGVWVALVDRGAWTPLL